MKNWQRETGNLMIGKSRRKEATTEEVTEMSQFLILCASFALRERDRTDIFTHGDQLRLLGARSYEDFCTALGEHLSNAEYFPSSRQKRLAQKRF